ncbi:MAG: sulfite exporter TauE/SafE family protein [Hyphomicrobiales bacterium]|nr:sulfite exporter TauE/SafE family protein [Hyphomicrobiales bacterium]
MPEHARTMPKERPDIARISTGRVRLLTALILLVFAGFTLHWLLIRGEDAPLRGDTFLLALAIGAAAQLVDGALGMAYGVTANSLLLALGLPPAAATATVHIAKAFTGAASGLSHWRLGNVDLRIFRRLVAPGILGGVLGAVLITTIDGRALRPWIAGYLLLMGLSILFRAFRAIRIAARPDGRLAPLALIGGFADSVGGGGWGPIVTTTMLGSGHEPRVTIGSVNAAEFFVTLASSLSFALLIGIGHAESVIGLILGGLCVAPLAATLTGRLDRRLLMAGVGLLICALSLFTILRTLGL